MMNEQQRSESIQLLEDWVTMLALASAMGDQAQMKQAVATIGQEISGLWGDDFRVAPAVTRHNGRYVRPALVVELEETMRRSDDYVPTAEEELADAESTAGRLRAARQYIDAANTVHGDEISPDEAVDNINEAIDALQAARFKLRGWSLVLAAPDVILDEVSMWPPVDPAEETGCDSCQ